MVRRDKMNPFEGDYKVDGQMSFSFTGGGSDGGYRNNV